MHNQLRAALLISLIAGSFYAVKAQRNDVRPSKAVTYDPYTYTGKWYGYVTDSTDFRIGYKATPEQIKKSVAAGASYVLYNPHGTRLGLDPAERVAPFVGQRVFVTGTITSRSYGSGPTAADEITNNGGFASPEPRSITTIKVVSMEATALKDAYDSIIEKGQDGK